MGLFGKKKKIKNAEPCCLCGNPEVEEKLADGWICLDCLRKSGGVLSDGLKYEDITKEKVIECTKANEKNAELYERFTLTKKVGDYLYVDETKRLWYIPETMVKGITPYIMSYEDFIDVNVQKNGVNITSGGAAGAITGGMLFGTTGAVVGSVIGKKTTREEITNLNMFVITKRPGTASKLFIPLYNGPGVQAGTTKYNYLLSDVESILSAFSIIKADAESRKQNANTMAQMSIPDEIMKYKNLLDSGIITQEEFEAKKKELLGL